MRGNRVTLKSNRLCEKTNDIVKKYLLNYVISVEGELDLRTNEATYAYNTSMHSSTSFSPADLTFGGGGITYPSRYHVRF